MFQRRSLASITVVGVLAFGASTWGLELGGTAGARVIPEGQAGKILYMSNDGAGGARGGIDDPALMYDNHESSYSIVRIPDPDDGTLWLVDDIRLGNLPYGVTEWEITSYGYMTYAFSGTAPYGVHSALYRLDACTSTPVPLIDLNTGDCCIAPEEIAGTAAEFTIEEDGFVEVTYNVPASTVVDTYSLMYLEFSGANAAGNAGWVVAGEVEDERYDYETGFTDDFWVEDTEVDGCGTLSFGGDPYAGFRAFVYGASAAVMDMIPAETSGASTIVGDTVYMDCHDLPMLVRIEVFARDWAPAQCKCFKTHIDCATYASANGTLTAIDTYRELPPFEPFCMCTDNLRDDFIFGAGFRGSNNTSTCPGGGGWYYLSMCNLVPVADDGTPKYMAQYPFEVGADSAGTWTISLERDPGWNQLWDPSPDELIVPLARNPAYIVVEGGRCCYDIGLGTTKCTDGVNECMCEALPAAPEFSPGEKCDSGGYPYGCGECRNDSHCDDNNACTVDECCTFAKWDAGLCGLRDACINTDITPEGYCCVPETGPEPIDDRDPCTVDWCNEVQGTLHHDCSEFCAATLGCRYLTIRPPNGDNPVALLVVGDQAKPDVSCISLYMQADGTLGETPLFQPASEWVGVFAHGEEIIPDATYTVYLDDGTTLSDPIELTTFAWADVNNDTAVNITDVMLIISGFQEDYSQVYREAVDLMPWTPDGVVGLTELLYALKAYGGQEYADTICSIPCPFRAR